FGLQDEKARKKQEIRERLEAEMKSTKKKGFMTPERKKKLRQLLRKKAAEELKREQELKSIERKRIIEERAGQPKSVKDETDEAVLIAICKEYYARIVALDAEKFDLEVTTVAKEYEVRGGEGGGQREQSIIPPLKKISKTATQMEKMRQWTMKLMKLDMKGSLKPVKKDISKELGGVDTKAPEWKKSMNE
ncbi:unnamed protein product, partial [Oppiella nova]